jgi:glycosyltransferase involved in cell wall biosynthesis
MEMHVPQLALGLKRRGHSVWIGAFPESPLFREAQKHRLSVYSFPVTSYFHPQKMIQLARFVQKQGIEIIHSHYSRDLWTIVPALRLAQSNVPLFLTKHIGTQSPKRDIFHRWLYARVNRIFANSEIIRRNIVNTHPVSSEKVETLHLGIDTQRFRPRPEIKKSVRKKWRIPADKMVVAIAGRLQRAKGYFEFIEMAEQIGQADPSVYFLLIGGASRGEEEEAERIRQRAQKARVANRLIFTGFRPDVENVLQAADIFVFPSESPSIITFFL